MAARISPAQFQRLWAKSRRAAELRTRTKDRADAKRTPKAERESTLHKAVFTALSRLRPACVWFPVPNGAGHLGPKEAARLQRMGAWKAGVSDFVFLWDGGAGCIELKTKRGRQSDAQIEFEAECVRLGVPYVVCRTLDAVLRTLVEWGRLPASVVGEG